MENKLSLEARLMLQVLLGFVGAPILFVMMVLTASEERRDTYVTVAGVGGFLSIFVGLAWWYFHRGAGKESLPEPSAWGLVTAVAGGVVLFVTPRLSPTGYLWVYMLMFFFAIATMVAALLRSRDIRLRNQI